MIFSDWMKNIPYLTIPVGKILKGPYGDHFQVHICMLLLYCDMSPGFNVQKALYFSHTACTAAPLFTLCLKPEPSLL